MPTVLNWPQSGEWLLGRPKSPIGRNAGSFYTKDDAPFAVLTVSFKSKTGTIREGQNTVPINGIQLRQTADGPKFSAAYAIGAHSGQFEATVRAKYELEIEFTGTAVTSVNAFPTNIVGGDNAVSSLSTQDKLQEAIRRALPMLPGQMALEVRALFTPPAIALLAGVAGLWAASHLAMIGWVADFALLVTAGLLLGKAAYDVGTHLAEFMVGACGAQTQQDLDDAARHFAGAILIGGTALVATILFSKKTPGRETKQPGAPAKPGQLPTENNLVPQSRIPPPSRAPLVTQGQQPQLAGLTDDAQQAVRALLNKLRKQDLEGPRMECTETAEALKKASGNKGIVDEYSGVSDIASITDHRMWKLGDEFIDVHPRWWREIFQNRPAARDILNRALPGLAQRLENGAVLTSAEYLLYRYGPPKNPAGVRPAPPGQPKPGGRAGPQPH